MTKLNRRSISRRTVEALRVEKDTVFWDRRQPGFGVRVYASDTKMYVAQARTKGKSVRVTVGRHGVISADEARRRAARILTPNRREPYFPCGSIPARAGEPRGRQPRQGRGWVYPRAGGGTAWHLRLNRRRMGLSPRGRGNHRHREPVRSHGGSIPARAGIARQSG